MVQLQAKPYKNDADDYLALAASFSMLMVFLCSIIYKCGRTDVLRGK